MDPLTAPHRVRKALGLLVACSPLLILLMVLAPARPALASGTVITNCANDSDLQAAVLSGGLITFNCNHTHAPATILLQEALVPADGTSVDGANGGHPVVLNGQGSTRVFQINASRLVTLTNLILTNGGAINGSCVVVEGSLEMDSVEVHHCAAGLSNFGGALYVDGSASATLKHDNLHDNSAGVSGGGLYSLGLLQINSSTFAHNTAGTDHGAVGDGGGVWASGLTVISGTTFFSNTAAVGYGGGLYSQSYLELRYSNVTDNWAAQWGGGVRNWSGTTNLINDTLSANQAYNGGGVASDGSGSLLSVSGSSLLGNQAQFFGGGAYHTGGIFYVFLSLFRNNSAQSGGGIETSNATPAADIETSTFSGNTAEDGAAIDNHGMAILIGDTLSGNTADNGGGLTNTGTASLTNDTLSGNTGEANVGQGGGIYTVLTSRTNLLNVTLAGNSAATGGGIFVDSGAVVTLTNTVMAYSPHGGNCGGQAITASAYSISSDNTCGLSGMVHGHSANGLDPRLTGLGNYGGATLVHMLEHGSPAIDGVIGSNAPAKDQRGQNRPANGGQGGGYDIGAVERQPGDTDLAHWLWLPLAQR
jgi:predicted outer membrane repeat protein